MCKLSSKLKLCTCSVDSVDKLKHYWVLYRYDKTKNYMIIGEAMVPYVGYQGSLLYNKALLLKRLNEADTFDVDLGPKHRDRLQLTFSCFSTYQGKISYGYQFENNRWIEMEYDPLEWTWRHNDDIFGKIIPALEENRI